MLAAQKQLVEARNREQHGRPGEEFGMEISEYLKVFHNEFDKHSVRREKSKVEGLRDFLKERYRLAAVEQFKADPGAAIFKELAEYGDLDTILEIDPVALDDGIYGESNGNGGEHSAVSFSGSTSVVATEGNRLIKDAGGNTQGPLDGKKYLEQRLMELAKEQAVRVHKESLTSMSSIDAKSRSTTRSLSTNGTSRVSDKLRYARAIAEAYAQEALVSQEVWMDIRAQEQIKIAREKETMHMAVLVVQRAARRWLQNKWQKLFLANDEKVKRQLTKEKSDRIREEALKQATAKSAERLSKSKIVAREQVVLTRTMSVSEPIGFREYPGSTSKSSLSTSSPSMATVVVVGDSSAATRERAGSSVSVRSNSPESHNYGMEAVEEVHEYVHKFRTDLSESHALSDLPKTMHFNDDDSTLHLHNPGIFAAKAAPAVEKARATTPKAHRSVARRRHRPRTAGHVPKAKRRQLTPLGKQQIMRMSSARPRRAQNNVRLHISASESNFRPSSSGGKRKALGLSMSESLLRSPSRLLLREKQGLSKATLRRREPPPTKTWEGRKETTKDMGRVAKVIDKHWAATSRQTPEPQSSLNNRNASKRKRWGEMEKVRVIWRK